MPEEALLGAFEGRPGRRLRLSIQRAGFARDVGGPHRGLEVIVDDAECAGIGVINPDLFGRELVLDKFVLDTFVRQGSRRIETERLEVTRQHLHCRNATFLDCLNEFRAGGEWEVVATPQAEPLGVAKIMHRRGARRGDVDDAGIRQCVLEAKPRAPLLGRCMVTALALTADRVLHRVALVKDDDAIEVRAQPFDDLLHA